MPPLKETSFGADPAAVVGSGQGSSSTDPESGDTCCGLSQCNTDADWNNWRCGICCCVKGRSKLPFWLKLLTAVMAALLFVAVPLIFTSRVITEFNFNSVVIGYGGSVWGVVGPGWTFPGVISEAIPFERYDANFNFSTAASPNDPIYLEIASGQIDIDVFVYYSLPIDNIEQIYIDHKNGVSSTIRQNARGTIRDTVASFKCKDVPRRPGCVPEFSHEWFHLNIEFVEAKIRADLKNAISDQIGVELTGFYLLDQNYRGEIADTALQKELVSLVKDRTAAEQKLDVVYKKNDEITLLTATNRTDFLENFEKETKVEEEQALQDQTRVEQETINTVNQITEESTKDVNVYNLNTQASIQEIELNISEVLQSTKRLVDEIQINSLTTIAVKTQENENVELNFTNQANLWQQRGEQAVVQLRGETEATVAEHEYELAVALSEARKHVAVLLAETREAAANERIAALRLAYDGLPAEVLLAEYAANATMADVRLMDASPESLVQQIHNLTHGDL